MARPTIAIALPRDERGPVADALREADLDPIVVQRPDDLAAHLAAGRHIALAILDGETDMVADELLEPLPDIDLPLDELPLTPIPLLP